MKISTVMFLPGCLVSIMLLSACSSHIPIEIRQALDGAPGVAGVREDADSYQSQRVRWGGTILQIENRNNASWLTIVAFPLRDDGKPRSSQPSPGRFIAISNEFLEPLVYSRDRKITVTGILLRTQTLKVGEFPYEYPVVEVDHHYLWPSNRQSTSAGYYPYRYDPWYNPFYPWHHPLPHHHRH